MPCPDWDELATFAVEAERLGVDSIWSPEGWGFDGATPLAYLAAKTSRIKLGTGVLQIGTRTPTNMAMTAMSLYSMSQGRFILGIGTSGPQVIEGFHGVVFDDPIQRTRETIEIMRQVFAGEPVAYEGRAHRLPAREGQGKSIRVAVPPAPDIPIYVASLGPAKPAPHRGAGRRLGGAGASCRSTPTFSSGTSRTGRESRRQIFDGPGPSGRGRRALHRRRGRGGEGPEAGTGLQPGGHGLADSSTTTTPPIAGRVTATKRSRYRRLWLDWKAGRGQETGAALK